MIEHQTLNEAASQVGPALLRFLISVGHPYQDAEDIVQRVFGVVLDKLGGGQIQMKNLADPAQMRAYLFATCKLLSREEFRKKQKERDRQGGEGLGLPGDAGLGLWKAEQQALSDRLVKTALARLDEDDKAMMLCVLNKVPLKGTAKRLGISEHAVKMRRVRVKALFVHELRRLPEWNRLEELETLLGERFDR